MMRRPRQRSIGFLVLGTAVTVLAATAPAQQENPVYVNDSPRAWELFQRAQDQIADNTGEAVRLFQELLDDYPLRLIPVTAAAKDQFFSVRRRVLDQLVADETLLERYRVMQRSAAERLLEEGQFEQLAMSRSMTEPGLDATLRLAQRALESAQFLEAMSWLREAERHPDLHGRTAIHCFSMLALTAHYLDRPADYLAARQRLSSLGADAEPFLRELEKIGADRGPHIEVSRTSLDTTAASRLTELVSQQIWSIPLEESIGNRDGRRRPGERGFSTRRPPDALLTVAPSVTETTVYINEGHTVRALDRFTGRPVWGQPYRDQPPLDLENDVPGDLNVVVVEGETLVTLTGHAYATKRSGNGQVICLDASTGALRWRRGLDRIGGDEEYEDLFPYGVPVIAEGSVYVLSRKVTKQSLIACYLVSLDLEDGSLGWIRHVASSGARQTSARLFSTVNLHEGDLYVATSVGAIARINAATGLTRWLRRFNVPLNPMRSRDANRPWQMSRPIVTADRVIAITPDDERIVELDRSTGDQLASHDARRRDRWNSPTYLIADDRHLYAVGEEIRAFTLPGVDSGPTLSDAPLWRLPPPAVSTERAPDPAAPDATPSRGPTRAAAVRAELDLQGRVQLTEGALIVPTERETLIVDNETGQILHRLSPSNERSGTADQAVPAGGGGRVVSGNPVAVGSQLLIATTDSLDVYMSLARAEQILRARLEAQPDRPGPAFSLLRLGMRARDLQLALEAARLAFDSIAVQTDGQQSAAARDEVLNLLLEIHAEGLAESPSDAEALYALIAEVADSPSETAEHLIVYGDWLRGHDPSRAVQAYQRILDDPLLAGALRDEAAVRRRVADWAVRRLRDLIQARGREIYAPIARRAENELERLRSSETTDAEALHALALRYPFAEASTAAALDAASIALARGEEFAALSTIMSMYHRAPRTPLTDRLLGRLVTLCLETGRREAARTILSEIDIALGVTTLLTADGARDVDAWLDELTGSDERISLPRIGDVQGLAERLDGQLIPLAADGHATRPRDAALLADRDTLALISADQLDERWRSRIDATDVRLLHADENRLLLWFEATVEDPRILALDRSVGRELWMTPPLDEVLEEPPLRNTEAIGEMPNRLPFDPKVTLPVVGPESIFLVKRTGGIAAFDPDHGGLRWARHESLEEVHLVEAHSFGIVLAGRSRRLIADGGTTRLEPRILVLDPRSGQTIHRYRPPTSTGVVWMRADPFGSLLCGYAEGIERFDLLDGATRWLNFSYEARETQRAWLAPGRIVVESRAGGLTAITIDDGSTSDPFDTAIRGEWDSTALQDVTIDGDTVIARFRERIVRYDLTGRVFGADAVTEDREYIALVRGRDRMIVLSQEVRPNPAPERNEPRTVRVYRLYVLSDDCRIEGDVIERPATPERFRDMRAINGWLLLTIGGDTLALPLDPGTGR